jgi:hypothetical protein
MGTIADYTPHTAPMIPSIIVHCVNEVDRRGLNEAGIYRLSGADKDVRGLKVCQHIAGEKNKVVLLKTLIIIRKF